MSKAVAEMTAFDNWKKPMKFKKLPVYIQERIKRHIHDDLGVDFDPDNEGHVDMAEEYADMEAELR